MTNPPEGCRKGGRGVGEGSEGGGVEENRALLHRRVERWWEGVARYSRPRASTAESYTIQLNGTGNDSTAQQSATSEAARIATSFR